jgi:hypothetical protein
MRVLLLIFAVFCLGFNTLSAQMDIAEEEPTAEDYERIIKNTFEVEFRELAINVLDMDEATIEKFTPLYFDYMEAKADLMNDRNELIEEHKEEMSEDQPAAEVDDEAADFVEDYWALDIDEMQIEKYYFDKLEDIMTYKKAMRFFELEEGFRSRIARAQLMEYVPVFVELEPVYVAYQAEKSRFNDWESINIDGKVGIDHNFTHDGLTTLLDYAAAMVESEGISVDNFEKRRKKIMLKADKVKKDWDIDQHADLAREAFVMTAKLLQDIHYNSTLDIPKELSIELLEEAKQINPNILLVDQADNVYLFFERAETVINRLANQAAMQNYDSYGLR